MSRTVPTFIALFALAGSALPGAAALPQAVGETPVPTLSPMIKRVSPAIVNVATRGTVKDSGARNPLLDDPLLRKYFDLPPRERSFQSAGSGVIFDAKSGYILTNSHVVENATEITITLQDGRDLKADVVGSDGPSDVAVLKVQAGNLTQIPFGDSTKVEVGDFVVAIGNPFGLQNTVTSGIVSGLGRSNINPDFGYEDFIQTDASINPGNSGGALVNLKGELIGINTAILSRTGGNIGIGFAIPVNMARTIMDQLVQFGSVKRGLLGVETHAVRPDIAQALGVADAQGVLVTRVVQGSSADTAGIRTGDIITSINGHAVRSPAELRNSIGLLRVGDKVGVSVLRDGKPQQLTAVIGEPNTVEAASASPSEPGTAEPEPVHQALEGLSLGDAPEEGGAVVRNVEEESPAAEAGLKKGDVILTVNNGRVKSVEQFRTLVKDAKTLVLKVRRGKTELLIPVR
jgi:Do/DeqQ family serine protease